MKTLHEMKLHDKIYVSFSKGIEYEITRVPGGWIYQPLLKVPAQGPTIGKQITTLTNVMPLPPVFVPFNEEFNNYDPDPTIKE
jgi:hypothetical protein